jgi:uncharacterized membrane protein YccC
MATNEQQGGNVALGLRIAVASAICLVVTEWFHLQQAALSVYTAFLVMATFPVSSFQKGIERFLGRALGVGYGLLLIRFCLHRPALFLALMMVGQVASSYVSLSGRLGYAALMAAVFTGVMAAIGLTAPQTAFSYAQSVIPQLLLGEMTALVVNLITGAERALVIQVVGSPLWPLRREWLNTAAMLSVAQVGVLLVTVMLRLPATATMVSAMIIGIAPSSGQTMFNKAVQRSLGAVLGGGYACASIVILMRLPHFVLLLALVFLGIFLATYFTKASKDSSYAFLQMGLVMPMVLIESGGGLGSVTTAVQRLVGVAVGLFIAQLVAWLWPHTPAAAPVLAARPADPPT